MRDSFMHRLVILDGGLLEWGLCFIRGHGG